MAKLSKTLFLLLNVLFLTISSFVFSANNVNKIIEPQVLIIFGAAGDLSHKKLFPALNELFLQQQLPINFACIGIGRTSLTDNEFKNRFHLDEQLQKKIFYVQANFNQDEDYKKLKESLLDIEKRFNTKGNRVFYLATPASHFAVIIQKLKEHELVYNEEFEKEKWSRVIIEKPLGHDYQSALQLHDLIFSHLGESQVYLIDHYLGKEVVQNLFTFRFRNPVFESFWNHDYISSVQITISEDIGIGDRGQFWEETGLLRDLVQNHAMQILSLIAMEKPSSYTSQHIHEEKIKLLKAIRTFSQEDLDSQVIRGQYGPGIEKNKILKGYREEKNVNANSSVETFVAAKLYIDNPRWKDVPFYIVAGKRLKEKLTEVTIHFKHPSSDHPQALIFRIQPNEEIAFIWNSKSPTLEGTIEPVKMTFNYHSLFQKKLPDAYERLLYDCMLGDKSLFVTFQESLLSWKLFTPVLKNWQKQIPMHFPNYTAGSEGPHEVQHLFNFPLLKESTK